MHTDQEKQTEGTLIRAYGEYWSRSAIDWRVGKLIGRRRHYRETKRNALAKEPNCDAWKQVGIYALYDHYKLVYVGMASSERGLGDRLLAHHTKPRLSGRWDTFSWFGLYAFDNEGKMQEWVTSTVVPNLVARTLELVAILVADPPLNRAGGRFPGAEILDLPEKGRADRLTKLLDEVSVEVRRLRR